MITATFRARQCAASAMTAWNTRALKMSLHSFSQTAIFAAICRAAHQMFDEDPKILHDPIAVKFIDDAARTALSKEDPALMANVTPAARTHFCLRSRIAEDCLERAVSTNISFLGLDWTRLHIANPIGREP